MVATMRALVKEGSALTVRSVPKPQAGDGDVVVRVALAGLCRTDLYAASGKIKVADPLVLGHELAGVVDAVGAEVDGIRPDYRVTVNPLLSCGTCAFCASGHAERCQRTAFLGVDRNGAFAEFVTVPAEVVVPLGDDVSFIAAAYAEPIAASLAVLKSGVAPGERGLIVGDNRFSRLMQRILEVRGFGELDVWKPADEGEGWPEGSAYDFVVETTASTATLRAMVHAVRPGGRIVLKSRQPEPVMFSMIDLIKKEPVIYPVNYGSFSEAVAFVTERKVQVEDLVDGVYPLERFDDVFTRAGASEALKPFFDPSEG